MFSAVDPIPMIQLMNLLGNSRFLLFGDKAAEILRNQRKICFQDFVYTMSEIDEIKASGEKTKLKLLHSLLTNLDRTVTYCEVKTIYIAVKIIYIEKKKLKKPTIVVLINKKIRLRPSKRFFHST
jgi:hypothetical protein